MQPIPLILTLGTFCATLILTHGQTRNITRPQSKCGDKEKASVLLDVTTDLLKTVKDYFPNCTEDGSNCGRKETSLTLLEVATSLVSRVKKLQPTCPDPECPKVPDEILPMDCSEILKMGRNESGIYTIWPRSRTLSNASVNVFCDMDTDGGGWTVIQRRGNFSTPKDYFYKNWQEYRRGFGDITEEFWIGNDIIHALSNQAKNTIRFDLKDAEGNVGYAEYHSFWIDDEINDYTLRIKGYSGNVGDAMDRLNNLKFTTKDRDNDKWNEGNCGEDRKGGWWYENCTWSNLNGLNQPGVNSVKGMQWFQWRKDISLAEVEIKLRSR